MKDKINAYAKGIFTYQNAPVLVTPQELTLSVDAGECLSGSFTVSDEEGSRIKGMVCTECHAMQIETEVFQGEENTICFLFHGENLMPGECVSGKIQIISDKGSYNLPFSVTVNLPSCRTSTGKLRDLYQFAALAEENYREAAALFQSPHFEKIFLKHNDTFREIYRGLVKGSVKAVALEEFLIAIHKKVPVRISTDRLSFLYEDCREQFQDHITLHKDSWGMEELQIAVDGEFLTTEQRTIRTSQFVGHSYTLPFIVRPDRMRDGRNYGRITVSGVHQSMEILIEARKNCNMEQVQEVIRRQNNILQMEYVFQEFQGDRITVEEYKKRTEKLVLTMEKAVDGGHWISTVFRIHLDILKHREEAVAVGLGQMEEELAELHETAPEAYCAWYYLKALWRSEEAVTRECVRTIRECYVSRSSDWRILWFLLCLDKEYESPRKKMDALMEQLEMGCTSPVIYLEMCRLLEKAPGLLMDLDARLEQCLHWGCVHRLLSRELAMRYSFLVGRQKNFSGILLEDMRLLYQTYPDDELLTIICKMQMNRRRVLEEDREWYELGIEKNLKLTDLYEYYIYSLDNLMEKELPQGVLLYFLYNNHLNAGKKAALYAYIVQKYARTDKTYQEYRKAMEEFTLKQLMEGRINEDMAVLYQEFIQEDTITQQIAQKLPAVLFSYEITCYHSDIVGIYVHYRELEKEDFIPLVQGKAIVSLFGQAQLFLTDRKGHRYCSSIDYTSHKLLHMDYLAEKCLEYAGDDYRLLLHLYNKAESMNQTGAHVMELRKRVLEIPQLSLTYKKKVFASQVHACYDNFEGELLDNMLEHMDWNQIEPSDREKFLEYCAIRHCYEKAMEGIRCFGFGKLPAGRLLQAAGKTFATSGEDAQLVKLAWYIFDKGQFDENLLRYLGKYYIGSVPKMVQIWKAADGFGIPMPDFQERILAQSLFTDELKDEVFPVFYSYYEQGVNKKLIRAFLKYTAYCFLVHHREMPEEMFGYFYQEVRVEENRPCLLASLKYLSGKDELTKEETEFVRYHLLSLWEKHIVFGFYQDFQGKVSLPEQLMSRVYVEYTADSRSQVLIRYRISGKDEEGIWQTKGMEDMYEGIRVMGFVLFQDEELEYSIQETDIRGESTTSDTRTRRQEAMRDGTGNTWYEMLNRMIQLADKTDSTSGEELFRMMKEYAQKKEFVDTWIKPLS